MFSSNFVKTMESSGKDRTRVELHVHLDGAARPSTAWELAVKKNLPLPCSGSFQDFVEAIAIKHPKNLEHFLEKFNVFLPSFKGDLKAIHRLGMEFCEDVAKSKILYVEARFCPHLLLSKKYPEVTADHVVQAILKSFRMGEEKCGITVRTILCCISGRPEWSKEIFALCEKYRSEGIVGIDIAGNDAAIAAGGRTEVFTDIEKAIFNQAASIHLNRTVHAGESGNADHVLFAVDQMFAQRIGHGYRVVRDQAIYERCLKSRIHFEACPTSSILTGSVALSEVASLQHPVVNFCRDKANFSINTDDPTVTGTSLADELRLVTSWGFTEGDLTRATFNAARSCFLPEDEKKSLIKSLRKAHGIDEDF